MSEPTFRRSTAAAANRLPAPALAAALWLALAGAGLAIAGDTDKAPKDPLSSLEARNIGPALGGRVARVSGVPGNPRLYFAATAMGGVWRSTDGGHQWSPVFDDQPIASMGSIAVADSDPNVLYAGSGEANIRGNAKPGNGIYKSTDGGKTWTQVWKQTGQIGALAIDPRDADTVLAAVFGHAFGPNPERGVYKTSDGGKTWRRVLYRDVDTGASDVAFDPSNPRVAFAGLWQARRKPWEMTSGGPGSGLFVSRDGGETWKELDGAGLPPKIWGKVGVRVAPSDGRRVYALIEAEKGGLYRSDDGGESWEWINPSRGIRQRAWYYTTLTVDPTNADVVWFPQVPLLKTLDGGRTLRPVTGGGWDYHDLWIDPKDTQRLIVGSDAGVSLSLDGGESWRRPPLPLTQHYHVAVDRGDPYRVYASSQDNISISGPSDSLNAAGIQLSDWHWIGGGEAGDPQPDPSDPSIVYGGEYLQYFSRYDHQSRQARNVSVYPENLSGHGAVDGRYRFQWTAPILVSPHDAKTVYHAGNVIFRTRDGGQTWEAVSPDLTRDDETKQQWSGGPITGDNTGVEFYGVVFALAESPLTPGLLWAGTDDGLVHVSRDGGGNWQNVTKGLSGLPEWATIAGVHPSPHAAGTAWVVAHNYRLDDPRPFLWKTTDFGRTWKSMTGGLDPATPLHVVREDPARRDLVYLGTEKGLQLSFDGGASWRAFDAGLPTVAVHDVEVTARDLVIGTMGRSIWILDDLTPVREWNDEVAKKALHIFPVASARRIRDGYEVDPEVGVFSNPPRGAVLHYALGADLERPSGSVDTAELLAIEIRDASGRLVRRLSSTPRPPTLPDGHPDASPRAKPAQGIPTDAGLHRLVWDLRWDGPEVIAGAMIDWGDPTVGPTALPGDYTATIRTAGGEEATTSIRIEQDPRVRNVSSADLEAQLAFALEVRQAISGLSRSVGRLRSVRAQLTAHAERLAARADARTFQEQAKALVGKLDVLERRYHNPTAEVSYDILAMRGGAQLYSRLSPLYSFVDEGDGAPTQGLKEVFAGHQAELAALDADLQDLLGPQLDALEPEAKRLGLGWITR